MLMVYRTYTRTALVACKQASLIYFIALYIYEK